MTTGKRLLIAKGKGYLNAVGPQARFIVFLIFVLIVYTFLLQVFQKLAEILQLPLFLPIALIILLIFIGIVGIVYSHKFLGPMIRIRRTIEQMTEGDMAVSLRLRDADDPLLKDLARSLSLLCEQSRKAQTLTEDAARELFQELDTLSSALQANEEKNSLKTHMESVRKKQQLLDKAVKAFRRT